MTDELPQDDVEKAAFNVLYHVWRGIDSDFKSKYKRDIWRIFEDRVRVAANQNGSVRRFVDQLGRMLASDIGRNAEARDEMLAALKADDRQVLRRVRQEASYLVLLVRFEMQKVKELYENGDTQG